MILHLTDGTMRCRNVTVTSLGHTVYALELNRRDVEQLCNIDADQLRATILTWLTWFPPMSTYRLLVPKGEALPQTVENLQKLMARDAETMLEMKAETATLKEKLNQAQQAVAKLNRREM